MGFAPSYGYIPEVQRIIYISGIQWSPGQDRISDLEAYRFSSRYNYIQTKTFRMKNTITRLSVENRDCENKITNVDSRFYSSCFTLADYLPVLVVRESWLLATSIEVGRIVFDDIVIGVGEFRSSSGLLL